jgi:hypothetical protein
VIGLLTSPQHAISNEEQSDDPRDKTLKCVVGRQQPRCGVADLAGFDTIAR